MTAASGPVVVIDVLRAFTTAAYAFALGVERILLVESVDTAADVRRAMSDEVVTLADGPARPDIDLVNSPVLLADVALSGRTLVMATTNGTVAAIAARDARPLLCASFANATATVAQLPGDAAEVAFVPSGGAGADEDAACADYLDALLRGQRPDATPYLERVAASDASRRLGARVADGDSGVHRDDVATCLRVDSAPFALIGTPHEYGVELATSGR